MNPNSNNEKKMSIRLDKDSITILDNASKTGITKTDYINRAIHDSDLTKQIARRSVQPHLARLQSLLECCEDIQTKNEMREELHRICLYLKS